MGMACEVEGRSAASVGTAHVSTTTSEAAAAAALIASNAVGIQLEAVGTLGKIETKEEKERRARSNSEETALILTSMMSMAGPKPAGGAAAKTTVAYDSGGEDIDGTRHSDMGEDQSGDERDDDDDDRKNDYEDGDVDMGDGYQGHHRSHANRVSHVHFEGPTGSKLDFTDDAGFNHRFRHESNRVKSLVTKHISIDELREHFDRPIIDVAKDFGICITLMKKICRRNGIKRWPHRQIRSLSKSIASMEAAMLSSQGQERDKYRDQIISLKLKRDAVIADPNKENSMARPKTPTKETTGGGSMRPHGHVHTAPKMSPRSGSPSQPSATPKSDGQASSKGGRWTSDEHAAFLHGIRLYGKDWRRVAQVVRTRSAVQTRTHAQKYLLKFAGRFPFDAEGLQAANDGNTAAAGATCSAVATVPVSATDGSGSTETASIGSSSQSYDDEIVLKVETSEMRKSALETMAMILNSPQFGSYRGKAPSPLQIEPVEQQEHEQLPHQPVVEPTQLNQAASDEPKDDVVMESPRGVPESMAALLLPSLVIKPRVEPLTPSSSAALASPSVDPHESLVEKPTNQESSVATE